VAAPPVIAGGLLRLDEFFACAARKRAFCVPGRQMSAIHGADPGARGVRHDDPVDPHYVIPAILAALVVVVVIAVIMSVGGSGADRVAASAATSKLPPFWTVRRGDSYSTIAQKTGLSVDQLESFNPYTNPAAIRPGQKLKLRLHVPAPKPQPKGPMFHTVRTGESFGAVAAKTGHSITTLQELNPKLKPTQLQPGDRMRLRR
jgi:LysM repeat protein